MSRARFIVLAPMPGGAAGLVELRPFKTALATSDALICATLQSYCSRELCVEISTACAEIVLPRPCITTIQPGAAAHFRIGLRLGALHVERAVPLLLREHSQRRDAPPFELTLPIVVSPIAQWNVLRAA